MAKEREKMLALKKETLRQLTTLTPSQLEAVGGGHTSARTRNER